MYTNQVPQNHEIGPQWGPGGTVWAQTLSERRPEPQDHFTSPPGPKNPILKIKQAQKRKQHPGFCRALEIKPSDDPLERLLC